MKLMVSEWQQSGGYFGSICASHLSLLGPVITVQNVPWLNKPDIGGVISAKLGITSIPVNILINRSGKIVYFKNGGQLDLARIRSIIMTDN